MDFNHCPNCGTELSEDVNFCPDCGTELGESSVDRPEPAEQQESIECARCGEASDSGTKKCPNCEYGPQESMQQTGAVFLILGFILSSSIVGSPLGIPMMIVGFFWIYKGGNLTIESERNI